MIVQKSSDVIFVYFPSYVVLNSKILDFFNTFRTAFYNKLCIFFKISVI